MLQGMQLVARAIRSGIFNDLGSGSNVDLSIITKGKVRALRSCRWVSCCPRLLMQPQCCRSSAVCMRASHAFSLLKHPASGVASTGCGMGELPLLASCRKSSLGRRPAQVEYLRNYERLQDKTYTRAHPVKYAPGTTSEPRAGPCMHACIPGMPR